jgi:flagellar protein FlaG
MIGQTLATEGRYANSPAVNKGRKAYSGNSSSVVLSNFPDSAAEVAERLTQNIADTQNSVAKIQKISDIIMGRTLQFTVNEDLGKVIIKVVDPVTNEVVREIPSEEMQRMQARMKDAVGLIFDENV